MHIDSASVPEHWHVLTDEQVVARVLAGQAALFEVLIRRYSERLYRTIRAMTQDEPGVEELMQQVYLHAYARLGELDEHQRFATWLTRIAIAEAMGQPSARERSEPAAAASRRE